ncbi:unnamed protein product [Bemisia tabaci]|uniref:Ionotropic receptor n=1 Tax=Bemisia tabaci TaxID=7038 RepID=A0A9P0AIL7_BEMTA|nr:unnamed protein product [Bemisia tabaci]
MVITLCISEAILLHPQKLKNNLTDTVVDVCKNAVKLSKQSFFYVVNTDVRFSVSNILERLHESSITTTVCDNIWRLAEFTQSFRQKNIVFFVRSFENILDLILASSARSTSYRQNDFKNGNGTLQLYQRNYSKFNYAEEYVNGTSTNLPNYCIHIDPFFGFTRNKHKCDFELFIAYSEMEPGVELSDHVHNATRGLFRNPIWNSKNHLIFVVSPSEVGVFYSTEASNELRSSLEDKPVAGGKRAQIGWELQFLFKFMWRFFKGIKTVICLQVDCFYYNPFAKRVLRYPISGADNQVNFDWNDWGGWQFSVKITAEPGAERASMFTLWEDILSEALEGVQESKKCVFFPFEETEGFDYYEDGQRYGPDILIATHGLSPEHGKTDFANFDALGTIEHCNLCIVTPRAVFVPQFLVFIKCVDPSVWLCFLMSALVLLLMQYIFQYSQVRIFSRLYSTVELFSYEETSALLTAWEYFMCGAPMRLLLGRLLTGKILFWIFIFAALIFSTVIQSRMFDLLSAYTRYSEIDTVEDLAESAMYIHVPDIDTYSNMFQQWPQYGKLREKLIQDFYFYRSFWYIYSAQTNDYYIFTGNLSKISSTMMFAEYFNRGIAAIDKNELAHMRMDAYVLSFPDMFLSQDNFLLKTFFVPQGMEVHRVKECLLSYPYSFKMPKDSFFFEPLNEKIVQLLETGQVKKWLESLLTGQSVSRDGTMVDHVFGVERLSLSTEDGPRPFNMVDLQLAFITLSWV